MGNFEVDEQRKIAFRAGKKSKNPFSAKYTDLVGRYGDGPQKAHHAPVLPPADAAQDACAYAG